MAINLFPWQENAIKQMHTGCVLWGGVGTGKTITSLAYYHTSHGGQLKPFKKMTEVKDLYIITTARKRDECDWQKEMCPFLLSVDSNANWYGNKVVVDSWNNIKKYGSVKNAFFIFDEQRLVGNGAWVKTFYRIAKENEWILLTATPGDVWLDYAPIFIANGYYRNITHFREEHVIYNYRPGFPVVDRYINTTKLNRLRDHVLVEMKVNRKTVQHHIDEFVSYDFHKYKDLMRNRWNYSKDKPIENASELCYELRKVVNSDRFRIERLMEIAEEKKKVIVFYNFDYELDLIKEAFEGTDFAVSEWNGHKHQEICSKNEKWIYLVQYNSGAEAWNCILTDTIVFYSQNYSYKIMVQASGRIDRMNTAFVDLYYYHLKSKSGLDLAIARALASKKKFNESKFAGMSSSNKKAA